MPNGLITSLLGLAVTPDPNEANPLVLYHGKCPDGFAAAMTAWRFFGGRGEYLGLSHSKETRLADLPDMTGRAVYILDFSFEADLLAEMDRSARQLVMLDHHKSAADKLNGFRCQCGVVHFDLDQSGAMLAWQFFFPEQEPPTLIRYVQDRDLWTWAYPESPAFLAALDMEPNDFARWSDIAQFSPSQVADFSERGKAMNEKFLSLAQDIASSAVPVTFNGQSGLMVNCPGAFTSEVGNILAEQCGSFALLWTVSKDNIVKVSLRAVRSFNAIPLAESMDGGGHPQACGFRMGVARLTELLSGTFNAQAN
ncbi:MAG: phosphoesterase [Burkholderiales bacterium]|nr:phosphoesterase [Burkholderiales bacterium]